MWISYCGLFFAPALPAQPAHGRDAWGNTALHRSAMQTHGLADLQALVRQASHSEMDSPGVAGMTPRGLAVCTGQPLQAAFLAAQGARLAAHAPDGLTQRRTLAHVFGLAAHTAWAGQKLDLGGHYVQPVYAHLANALQAFAASREGGNLWPLGLAQALIHALRNATHAMQAAPDALLQQLAHQDWLLLPSGWHGHSVCALVHENQVVLADRTADMGGWPGQRTFSLLGRPTAALLGSLQACTTRSAAVGALHMHWLKMRHMRPFDPLQKKLAAVHMVRLRNPSCVLGNAKAALRAALHMHFQDRQAAEVCYKAFTFFLRRFTLENHRAGDSALQDRCAERLAYHAQRRL